MRAALVAAGILAAAPLAAQEDALKRLESSPRHQEWTQVKSGERTVHSFVVFPEIKDKAPVVIVIHENRGLTDWVRTVADRLAEAGAIAIAPDLLSGAAPEGGRTKDFASQDAAREAIGKLQPDQVTADLNAVADYGLKLPAANGKLAVSGFCWGGGQTFRFATNRKDLKAAFVFYGTSPADKDAYARVAAPVFGFYGGNDERVNATIAPAADAMKALGKRYEPVTYEGAGHGFMRAGEEPGATDANRKARDEAWARWKELLKAL
ncbi:MAG TPA: dienelactone hydrolase family protein [Vicinamibacteria bacterium]|nr:dienelactone hydrolase family protein [Vicinamibacteria bacterium]